MDGKWTEGKGGEQKRPKMGGCPLYSSESANVLALSECLGSKCPSANVQSANVKLAHVWTPFFDGIFLSKSKRQNAQFFDKKGPF